MPMNRKLYPPDWEQISQRIRYERAGNRCEWCGAENHQPHPITGSKVVLTVAHLDHNPGNNAEDNLAALCQRCHNRYDAPKRWKNARRTKYRKQRQRAEAAGQLGLPAPERIK